MPGLNDFFSRAFGFVRSTKETYDAGTRFTRIRVWILALVVTDLIATLGYVFFSATNPLDVVVWFQPGFPANMLVVRNDGSAPLNDATLVLDEKYLLTVERIEKGPNGYEVSSLFRDKEDQRPPDTYRPVVLRMLLHGATVRIGIGYPQGTGGG